MYDYLVVGSGLYGAIFAHEAKAHGKSVLVVDKRPNIAGNIYTENIEGINVHKYGAHIFHTNNKKVWNYITQFAEFNRFTNSPVANYKGELYSLPFNMYTFNKMWGVVTPEEAAAKIEEQRKEITHEPQNLEEQAISLVGRDIYEKLIKGYTEKQWGRDCKDLPSFIIKRLPVRLTFDNNYFNALYQGIPVGGYTKMIAKFNGVKKRIYHAHNPKETSSIKAIIRSNIYEVPSVYFSNQYVACSSTAGDSLFGKGNYTILKNAMNTKRFEYDEKARKILRKELGIENNFVVGVVGRLAEQKNPYFVIDIFEKVKEKNPKACLIWAGDGQLKSPIERYIQKKNLEKFILMLGSRKDVDKLYSAMDAFLLPSKFEGLGLVFIEAQISGLQCFGSDKIPTDVEVSSRMHRISLSKTANEWADEIVRDTILNNNSREMLKRTGFEIEDVVSSLVKIYRM